MKPKTELITFIFCCFALLIAFFILDFQLAPVLLSVAFVFVIGYLLIKVKKPRLTSNLLIIGMTFFLISFLVRFFLKADYVSSWSFFPQALGTICCIVSSMLSRNENKKTAEKFKQEFGRYFKDWSITLPEADLSRRKSGTINKAGWLIKYRFDKKDETETLEVYAVKSNTTHRHFQILHSGELKTLPTLDKLQGLVEEALIAELEQKQLFAISPNPWILSYITSQQYIKSRYEIDKYLIEAGYNPGEIERIWRSLARPTS